MSARSDRPVVGFVCEGATDVVVLRRVVAEVLGPIESRTLQPSTDELDRTSPGAATGWSEVRAWCERVSDLDDYFDPPVGEPIDILVIAIDLDIAVRAGVQKAPSNLKAYDAKALCDVVKSWLPSPLPGRLVIVIPVKSIEAWILAALFSKRKMPPQLEEDPATVLVDKKKIEMGNNGPWKRASEYLGFAEAVAAKLKRVRSACSEADRFAKKIEAAGVRGEKVGREVGREPVANWRFRKERP